MLLCIYLIPLSVPTLLLVFFFLMIRRPPRATLDRSSAASDVYKRQAQHFAHRPDALAQADATLLGVRIGVGVTFGGGTTVSYTHLRAHETVLDLVCRLLLEKKKINTHFYVISSAYQHVRNH